MNYPSPCITCQKSSCKGTLCEAWVKRYRTRQKQINGYALQLARGEVTVKRNVWVYPHPDEVRRYLEHNPCESCFARDLCDTPCKLYLLWYDAHRERARRRLENGPC